MDLGRDNLIKLLLKFSVPTIVGMLINACYNLLDRVFVSYGVGGEAFSSMAVTGAFFMILQAIAMLIGIGAANNISITWGEGNRDKAEKLLGNAFIMFVVISLIVMTIVLCFIEDILLLFGASADTLYYGVDYLKIIMWGFPFMTIGTGLYHIARASGNPNKAMVAMIISVFLDAILNVVFIFIFHWGVKGAALSTVIGQGFSMVYMLYFFILKKNVISLRLINFIPDLKDVWRILISGLAPFFTQIASSAIAGTVNRQLLLYANSYAVGAYGAISMTYMIILMPVFGIGQGSQPVIGYNYGAKLYKRSQNALYYSLLMSFIIGIIGWLCFHLLSYPLMDIFTNGNREIMRYAVPGIERLTLFFPLATVQAVGQVYFQTIGKPKITLLLSFLRQIVFLIPFLHILPLFLGVDGVWYAIPAAELLALICTSTALFIVINKEKKMEAVLCN